MQYPACYTVVKAYSNEVNGRKIKPCSLLQSMKRYILQERSRFSCLDTLLAGGRILVYGFGDDFFRARSSLGPLFGRAILGVIDKRAEIFARTHYSGFFKFYEI